MAILVVDDNEMNRQVLVEHLAGRGLDVVEAESGHEALEAIEAGDFDLVILDVMMPGLDGITVLTKIRERFSLAELPVIMATARVERSDIVEALDRGANDYVTKPLDLAVVSARVRTQLALKRASDEVRRLNQQIARLSESAADALKDIKAWSSGVAAELASMIGARSITVWLIEGIELWSFDDTATKRPSLDDLAQVAETKWRVRDDDTLFAVAGLSGEVFGALLVAKKTNWSDVERRLLLSFAHQLGSALEVQRMRTELATAQSRVEARRQEMIERGIDILHVCPKCGLCYGHHRRRCGVDGTTLEAPRLLPLTIRGRYRLVRSISSGGMSKLFEAADEKLGRSVAVKLIRPEYFNDPVMRVRFEQEARAVARIQHPGVVAIYDSGEIEEGTLFFVMELLRGLNLGQVLQRYGRGTPAQVASLVKQIGSVLAAAHKAGFVHRDIKPENIFLIDDGAAFRVRLLDFGIAKPLDSDARLTQTGSFVGTPGYMSPEQFLGMNVDERTDLYSFAAVVYEALSGVRLAPKVGATLDVEPFPRSKPIADVVSGVPEEVARAINTALSDDPTQRPSDAEAWAGGIANALEMMESDAAGWSSPLLSEERAPLDPAQLATMPSRRRV